MGRRAQVRLEAPPLALYVHLPWCVSKCPYCDFNSYGLKGDLPETQYVEALARDLEGQAADVPARTVCSVFFGGGTPSLFSPVAIDRILSRARSVLAMAADAEITLEANPGTIERGRFAEYRAAGINRVSLGAQSFDGARLRLLGRIHSADETRRAAEELHAAGIANFNLDLMYGLPGQDVAGALADVEAALALAPAHLSHYHLTIEPGTAFAAHPPALPADEATDAMLAAVEDRLGSEGFARYEVSAFAREGRRCLHNLNYWRFGDYLGIGAGAHGKITQPGAGIFRTAQWREPRRYMAAAPHVMSRNRVAEADLPFEYLMNALRLVEGFEAPEFSRLTGLAWDTVGPELEQLCRDTLMTRTGERWHTTPLGARFLNDVVGRFLPAPAQRTYAGPLSIVGSRDRARYSQVGNSATANESITREISQVAE
jgi:putative oxygen-independent coproporphyrinogen III oxidase